MRFEQSSGLNVRLMQGKARPDMDVILSYSRTSQVTPLNTSSFAPTPRPSQPLIGLFKMSIT